MNQYLAQTENLEVKFWIEHNLSNYLKTNPENVSEIEHIIDYLNSDKAPKRLKKMSYDEAKRSSEAWVKSLAKQGAHIPETESDLKPFMKFSSGFRFVELVGENAFKREGFLMSHCVGSYYGRSETKIYSLRDPLNTPHCTIEVQSSNNSINQIKGKGNGSIHPDYIKMVLKFLNKIGMEIRSSEMQNLGYVQIDDEYIELMEKFYEKPSIKSGLLKLKSEVYFYKYHNLKVKPGVEIE